MEGLNHSFMGHQLIIKLIFFHSTHEKFHRFQLLMSYFYLSVFLTSVQSLSDPFKYKFNSSMQKIVLDFCRFHCCILGDGHSQKPQVLMVRDESVFKDTVFTQALIANPISLMWFIRFCSFLFTNYFQFILVMYSTCFILKLHHFTNYFK